jgi:uncharacterized heparinase superfamily protein
VWKPLQTSAPFFAARVQNSLEGAQGIAFTFLNETVTFDENITWPVPDKGRLWRYNLHYFDYINAKNALLSEATGSLIKDWIRNNPPGTVDAWDPYPVSLRTVNWIKYLSRTDVNNADGGTIAGSLYSQMRFLERNIEYHILANHLFKNIKALIFGGLFFSDKRGARWLSKGLRLLDRELDEQILPDGGHFERSPMYHSMIFEDCLDLLNALGGAERGEFDDICKKLTVVTEKMAYFLVAMRHPEGGIALFNDSAFGIEALPSDLVSYYERLTGNTLKKTTDTAISFPESGYFVMSPDEDNRLFIDCGPIGPDYQPGHAHCDTLSIELSLRGKKVVVDSGCYGYEEGPMRQYNRGNVGHNTVMIDGENQSEVWGSHRCARRARPIYARLNATDNALVFEGAHDGYQRLKGRPIHHRKVVWKEGRIDIEDSIDGNGQHDIGLRLHINPDLKVSVAGGEAAIRNGETVIARIHSFPNGSVTTQQGWYCPEFGKKLPCDVLVNGYRKVQLPFRTGWTISIL